MIVICFGVKRKNRISEHHCPFRYTETTYIEQHVVLVYDLQHYHMQFAKPSVSLYCNVDDFYLEGVLKKYGK